jgi:hypothetical protein
MDFEGFPRRSLHRLNGQKISVNENMRKIPAYSDVPVMNLDEMRAWAKENNGYIMQQDDPMLPPFSLHAYRDGQPIP